MEESETMTKEELQKVADEIAAEFNLPKVQKDIPCPNCYGGHFRPCQWCGDTGRVDFVPNDPSSATAP